MNTIKTKRIYKDADQEDGIRILVDRLWPRGIKRENAEIDLWLKDIGPSSELRKWFNHEPEKWTEFCKRYHNELTVKNDLITRILNAAQENDVTLLYSARDEKFNNAVALKGYLEHSDGPMEVSTRHKTVRTHETTTPKN